MQFPVANRKEAGELFYGDIVHIKGLSSEKGKQLNGKKGSILPSDEAERREKEGSTGKDTRVALNKNGRYNVRVDMSKENELKELGPSRYYAKTRTETFQLKRENLELIEGTIHSTLSESEMRALGMYKTAEIEASDPGLKGIFPAIANGDHVRLREIMEHIENKYGVNDSADHFLDGDGNTALLGAVQYGHLECVEILLEFKADPNINTFPMNPELQLLDASILFFAIFNLIMEQDGSKKKDAGKSYEDQERIIELLLKYGADPNKCSKTKGTPMQILFQSEKHSKFHDSRLRVLKLLLDHGADPNILSTIGTEMELLLIVDIIGKSNFGPIEYRIEIAKLLLEHGADPGKLCSRPGEQVNAIQMATNHRMPYLLELFLQSEKGSKSVNVKHITNDPCDGENALQLALSDDVFEKEKASAARECIIILLKSGADMYQKRHNGVTAFDWIKGSAKKHIELRMLLKKAPKRTDKKASMDYWDPKKNVKVKEFIGSGSGRQCPMCMVWSDHVREFNSRTSGDSSSGFQQCGRCKKQWYCSRECQKLHWTFHKRSCKEPSK